MRLDRTLQADSHAPAWDTITDPAASCLACEGHEFWLNPCLVLTEISAHPRPVWVSIRDTEMTQCIPQSAAEGSRGSIKPGLSAEHAGNIVSAQGTIDGTLV